MGTDPDLSQSETLRSQRNQGRTTIYRKIVADFVSARMTAGGVLKSEIATLTPNSPIQALPGKVCLQRG
jgi:hypothetical protein